MGGIDLMKGRRLPPRAPHGALWHLCVSKFAHWPYEFFTKQTFEPRKI